MSTHSDRTWMYKRFTVECYLDKYFQKKVDEFLDFAYSIVANIDTRSINGKVELCIKCPCVKCKVQPCRPRDEVKYHLLQKEFMHGYTTWWEHGETEYTVHHVGQCSNAMEDDEVDAATHMELNNIYPTDYNLGSSSEEEEVQEEEVPNEFAQRFYGFKDNDVPLYTGCQNWTKLQAATRVLSWKSDLNIPVKALNVIVRDIKSMLPKDNKLVESFYKAKKCSKEISLPIKKIHACKRHCMLFYDADASLTHCRWCGTSRYKDGGRKVPNLVLTYMPIADRLQMLYMSEKTAKDMTWHADHKTADGRMVHPSDGRAWKHFDLEDPLFAHEIRNVRLGLCTDGFSPTSSCSKPYTCWPVFISVYNLPPWKALKESYVQLALLIPGRKSPGQNIDVFLRPLIDELKDLYDVGVDTYDAYRRQNFRMKAILLWTVSDFLAYAMLSGWSTHGKLACPHCMGNIDSFQLQHGGKSCWFDCHRRFLPLDHQFRRDRKGFRAKTTVLSTLPPPELNGFEIWQQISDYPTVYEGTPYNPKNKKISGFGVTHNWVKRSIFWELPYWHLLLIRHNLDVMHIEKNVFENIINTVMDTSKTKDNIKARMDIEKYCDRADLHVWKQNNKVFKTKALYTLSKPQVKKVCEWLKSVKFPDGYASNIGGCVNLDDSSFYSFKSHECHVFMQRLLPIALKGMIPNAIWDVITELCTFFRVLCSKELHIEDLETLKDSIVVTICKLEKVFPPGFFDSMEHIVIHLVNEALNGGPEQYRWMHLYERKLGSLKRTIGNRARPEGSIVEAHRISELSIYSPFQFETPLNRAPRNYAFEIPTYANTDPRLSIFKVPSRRLFHKSGHKRYLDEFEKHKIQTYIMLNCVEVHPSITLFNNWIGQTHPNIEESQLDQFRERDFASWFADHILSGSDPRNENLKDLAYGPINEVTSHQGYIVNGYKFHTLSHGGGRVTNNTGVCVKESCYNEEESDYYGELEEVIEVDYHSMLGTCMIVLFKCRWFDPVQGVKVDVTHKLVDIKYRSRGCIYDPFILANQAQQVYYATYPSMTKDLKDWWAVVKAMPRGIFQVAEGILATEISGDDNVDGEDFFQENDRLVCTIGTTEDIQPVTLVREEIEEVQTGIVTDDTDYDGEEEFDNTNDDDDSSDDMDLDSSNHSSDDDA